MVGLVNLSCGRALLYEGDSWRAADVALGEGFGDEHNLQPSSRRILNRVREQKRTFWQAAENISSAASLIGVSAVVAAPILDRNGEVIGALYGDRRGDLQFSRPITQLEAILVETLACGVAAGLARLEQQKAAVAAEVRFEQFFTPELAHILAAQPNLLEGTNADVTVLFCDIRGFSRISERLSPAMTVEWVGDVISVMSDCVIAREGVLVDYVGDALMAMWGAPRTQLDHAQLACQAACDMMCGLEALNERWLRATRFTHAHRHRH